MSKNLKLYIVIAALFAGVGAWLSTRHHEPAPPLTTTIAPTPNGQAHTPVTELFAQSMNDVAGTPQALAQWKGKPLVVNFWAPWCGPCVQEMPELSALATEQAAKGIQVIGIGIDSPKNIADFAAKLHIAYPLYVAGMSGTALSQKLGNANGGLPYTVLIDANGQVRKTYLGRLKFDELKADLANLKS
ncbi:MAG: TlpA family protein disulfide reductase [Gammaproteobacteria bacterium]